MIKVGKYFSVGTVLGQGSFGKVYHGMDKDTKVGVAIKELDLSLLTKQNPKLIAHLDNEITIMKTMTHKNIVRLLECKQMRNKVYLVLEYCSLGDLQSYLRKQPQGKLNEDQVFDFMKQFAEGLKCLREGDILHRDLKPENLLLSINDNNNVINCNNNSSSSPPITLKIADFGFARQIEANHFAATLCGSPLHMAPEILSNQKYTVKSDLWSVGTIMFQMIVGAPLFKCNNMAALFHAIKFQPIVLPDFVSPMTRDLLSGLLQKDPEMRMSWEQFFSHPYFNTEVDDHHPLPLRMISPNSNLEIEDNNHNDDDDDDDDVKKKNNYYDDNCGSNYNNNNGNNDNIIVRANDNANCGVNLQISGDKLNRPPPSLSRNNDNDHHHHHHHPHHQRHPPIVNNQFIENAKQNVKQNESKGLQDSVSKVVSEFVIVKRFSNLHEVLEKVTEIMERIAQVRTLGILAHRFMENKEIGKGISLYYKCLQILQVIWNDTMEIFQYCGSIAHNLNSDIEKLLNSIKIEYSNCLYCVERWPYNPTGGVEKLIYDSALLFCKKAYTEETTSYNYGLSLEYYTYARNLLQILQYEGGQMVLNDYIASIQSRIAFLTL